MVMIVGDNIRQALYHKNEGNAIDVIVRLDIERHWLELLYSRNL